jgi:hypothetical protein
MTFEKLYVIFLLTSFYCVKYAFPINYLLISVIFRYRSTGAIFEVKQILSIKISLKFFEHKTLFKLLFVFPLKTQLYWKQMLEITF